MAISLRLRLENWYKATVTYSKRKLVRIKVVLNVVGEKPTDTKIREPTGKKVLENGLSVVWCNPTKFPNSFGGL